MTVQVTCYKKTETFPNARAAIKFYEEGIHATEGAEQRRYISIVEQLLDGSTHAVDTNPDYNSDY